MPRAAAYLGAAYTLGGRLADAVPLLMRAVELTVASEMSHLQALCRLSLGEVHLLAGRLEEAQALAERPLALAREHPERGHEAYAPHLLAEITAQRTSQECEHAEARYQQALILADELGMRPLQAHCHHGLGQLYAQSECRAEASAELSAAIELYRMMDMIFWLPQAEAALAQVEGR